MIIKIIDNKPSLTGGENKRTLAAIDYSFKKGEIVNFENTYALDVKSFKEHISFIEAQNERVEEHKKAFHVVFSLARTEICNDEAIREIIGDYMVEMGYGDQPYSTFKHTDREHMHFHIVSTRIDQNTGKKINDSHEHRKSERILKELSLKYGLSEYKEMDLTKRGLVFEVNAKLKEILKKKPHNLGVLNQYAEEFGLIIKRSKKGGYFIYSNNSPKGVKSSSFPIFADRALAKVLSSNNYYRTKSKKEIKVFLDKFIAKGKRIQIADFVRELRQHNIRVKFSRNASGIYGISFSHNFIEFKGSDLGKSYSWNYLANLIDIQSKSKERKIFNVKNHSTTQTMSSILQDVKKLSRVGQGIRGHETEDLSADKPVDDNEDYYGFDNEKKNDL